MAPKINSSYSRLLLIVLFLFPCFCTGQVDFSFTLGGNFSSFAATKYHLLREDEIYLIPDKGFRELGTTIGIKIQKEINWQFQVDYQLRFFNQLMEVACVESQNLHGCYDGQSIGFWNFRELDKADVFGTIHSISFNFRLDENLSAGIGGYYQMIKYDEARLNYFSIYRVLDYFYRSRSLRQAGCLGTVRYNLNKWTLEARFLKGVGDVFRSQKYPGYLKSVDAFELSLSYKFLTKEKKNKKAKDKSK